MKDLLKMSNATFDLLKWTCILFLPALATLVLTVGKIWGLPYCDGISQTITAVAVFIGACLKISNIQYDNALKEDEESTNEPY